MSKFFHNYPYENFHELNLDWILNKVKELETEFNEWKDIAEELIKLVPEIEDIKNQISDLPDIREELASNTSDIQTIFERIEYLTTIVEGYQDYIDSKVDELYAYIQENDYLLLLKINQIKANLQAEIDEILRIIEEIDTSVYNSWMNEKVSNQVNTDFAFNHLADECLTASQYDSLGLTADDYAEFDITSRDYQEFGKDSLHFKWVFSPAYGFKQEINNVLTSIVNFISGTISATQYSDLDLTADEYDSLDLTSEDYFKYNPFSDRGFVSVDPSGIGLTVEQYAHLNVE